MEDLQDLRQRDFLLRLDVDALSVSGMNGDANGRREDGEARQGENLTGLLLHLLLLRRVPALVYAPDKRDGVPNDGLGKGVLAAILQGLNPATAGTRDRLVGRNDYPLQAKLAGYGGQRYDQLNRRTVGVGDDALVVRKRLGVHLGHYERHLRVEPEIAPVIYYDSATCVRLVGELHRGPLFSFGPGEKGVVHTLEGVGLRHPDLKGLADQGRYSRAPGQDAQLRERKFPPFELRHQLLADEASAYDRDRVSLTHARRPLRYLSPLCELYQAGQ